MFGYHRVHIRLEVWQIEFTLWLWLISLQVRSCGWILVMVYGWELQLIFDYQSTVPETSCFTQYSHNRIYLRSNFSATLEHFFLKASNVRLSLISHESDFSAARLYNNRFQALVARAADSVLAHSQLLYYFKLDALILLADEQHNRRLRRVMSTYRFISTSWTSLKSRCAQELSSGQGTNSDCLVPQWGESPTRLWIPWG